MKIYSGVPTLNDTFKEKVNLKSESDNVNEHT